jgi:hypothetical protein
MASVEYLNAAFDSAKKDIQKLLVLLPDIPFVDEQAVARSSINSAQGTAHILALVKNAAKAGEAADAAKTGAEKLIPPTDEEGHK